LETSLLTIRAIQMPIVSATGPSHQQIPPSEIFDLSGSIPEPSNLLLAYGHPQYR
jgi:hypothetical protein